MSQTNRPAVLAPRQFIPLPLGEVRPAGWLRGQLQIQADGLSGHLDEFWPDVARSAWIGGDAASWERGPYWLDGMIPLAHLLGDERLQAKVTHWVDEILARQGEDGWFGPVVDARLNPAVVSSWRQLGYPHDPWPRFIVLKALAQQH